MSWTRRCKGERKQEKREDKRGDTKLIRATTPATSHIPNPLSAIKRMTHSSFLQAKGGRLKTESSILAGGLEKESQNGGSLFLLLCFLISFTFLRTGVGGNLEGGG